MKAYMLLLSLPIAAALAFAPQQPEQDPAKPAQPAPAVQTVSILPLAELRYEDLQGQLQTISSRSVVEIRIFDDHQSSIRFELLYDNGDYALIDARAIFLLRQGTTRDVRLVRTGKGNMRFPELP